MIHEMRTYTFHPGKLPEYLKAAETIGRPVRGNDYGVNHGYWTTEFGALNQVWHLWSYDSFEERTRLRAALAQNARWTKEYIPAIRPLMARQDIRFINPMKDVVAPAATGGVYELRIYRTQVGMARAWADMFKGIFPVREKYSKNVGLWVGEAPQPNEALHMWNYPGVNERVETRKKVFADPDWQQYLRDSAGMVVEMQSLLLMPTSFSPLK